MPPPSALSNPPIGRRMALGARGALVRYGSERGGAALAFMPGANCPADRYAWLAGLCGQGLTVYIFDPAVRLAAP